MLKIQVSPLTMAMIMSEGNPKVLALVSILMRSRPGATGLVMCLFSNIRGMNLYTLYKECCNSNHFLFERTALLINSGVFSKKQIKENISSNNPIPFIDESLQIYGVPSLGEMFGPNHYKWKEFCEENKKSFINRFNKNFFEDSPKKYYK